MTGVSAGRARRRDVVAVAPLPRHHGIHRAIADAACLRADYSALTRRRASDPTS